MTIFKEWKSCICPNCGTVCECIRNLIDRDIRIACPNCLSDYTIHCNYDFEEYSWDKWKKDARPGRLIPEEVKENGQ